MLQAKKFIVQKVNLFIYSLSSLLVSKKKEIAAYFSNAETIDE